MSYLLVRCNSHTYRFGDRWTSEPVHSFSDWLVYVVADVCYQLLGSIVQGLYVRMSYWLERFSFPGWQLIRQLRSAFQYSLLAVEFYIQLVQWFRGTLLSFPGYLGILVLLYACHLLEVSVCKLVS